MIASDKLSQSMNQMLEAYDDPAILVSADYQILASNRMYQDKFGAIDLASEPRCFKISHGYNKPCDQAGEHCPLLAAKNSGNKEKVLHIHQTKNGKEHVDVEMIPIFDQATNELQFFVELLKPVPLASGASIDQKMIGESAAFKRMLKSATKVAPSEANVLLLGESGTGKELVAQSIHLASARSQERLVALECAGLSETLIESELFGHEKGAFTGANSTRKGLVEEVDGGTLFLDEIGDVPLATQVKLLRLIESKTFRRVGSTEVRTSDFRLICATHKNLQKMVENGEFRLDLFYRINVFPIRMPSLEERAEDIAALAKHMLLQDGFHITQSALKLLRNHQYQGNIRELKNILSRAVVLCETNMIEATMISEAIAIDHSFQKEDRPSTDLKALEQEFLKQLLDKHRGDKSAAAKEAGMSLRTLYRKLSDTR